MVEIDGAASSCNVIKLEEGVEGNQIGTCNYRFSRIGEPLPVKPDADPIYDLKSPPSRPLAVSERFGVIFVAHSTGFCVARTKDVMKSAEEMKDEGKSSSILELSVVDVPINGKVSILALTVNSSTLAVSFGCDLQFFSVSSLLNKEQKPSFSYSCNCSSHIKDIRWSTKVEDRYVVLSSNGKLYYGSAQDALKDVMDDVDAVEWSTEGKFVAVARKNVLSILSSKFKEKLQILLSFESWVSDSDANSVIKVDSVSWVRPDYIILGCYQLTDDGREENYLVQVITGKDGNILNASSSLVTLSFNDVFVALNDDALPVGSGPHMILSYLDGHELAFLANRKNTDQHIVLFGWSLEEENEAAIVEILNDAWLPRIYSQGNGDDNLILGISVDKVSPDDNVKFMLGDEDVEVSPCCILLCLTVDGKLTMFNLASAKRPSGPPEVLYSDSDEEDNNLHVEPSGHELLKTSADDQVNIVDEAFFGLHSLEEKVKDVNGTVSDEIPERSRNDTVDSQLIEGGVQLEVPVVKLNPETDTRQPLFPGKQVGVSEATLLQTFLHVVSKPVVSDFNRSETHKLAEVGSNADSLSRIPTEISNETLHGASPKDFGVGIKLPVGSAGLHGASSDSWSTGALNSSKTSDVKSSHVPFTGVQGNRSDASATTFHLPVGPLQNPSYSIRTSGSSTSANILGNNVSFGAGIPNSLSVVRNAHSPLCESFTVEKPLDFKLHSDKGSLKTHPPIGLLNSEPKLSKQFRSVEEMAKELDALLECIEGPGGFNDAAARQQNSVVELEEGIWTLSDECRIWTGIIDQRLAEIQLLLDKTVQVLARKIYMEGIVKQASDSHYWDLWNKQKLSSELEMKHRHILEINQNLTNQLIELERHLNSLELKRRFGENDGVQVNRRSFQSKHGPPRHVQSLQSLHNTMSAQLAAAEQLSDCLSKQMAVLSIESAPVKKQNVRKELFETIGISYDADGKKAGNILSKKEPVIASCSAASISRSTRNQLSAVKNSEPETARRRRDSLDRNWASFEPPKTTVKRMVLQEECQMSPSRLSSSNDKQKHNSRLLDISAVSRDNQAIISSSFLHPSKSKGNQDTPVKQSSKGVLTSPYRLADYHPDSSTSRGSSVISPSSTFQAAPVINQNAARGTPYLTADARNDIILIEKSELLAVNDSKSAQQSKTSLDQRLSIPVKLASQTLTSPKKSSEFSFSGVKETGISKSTTGFGKQRPIIAESSFSQFGKSLDSPFSTVSAAVSAPTLSEKVSQFEASTNKSQLGEVTSSTSSLSVPVTSLTSFVFKPTVLSSSSTNSLSRLSSSSEAATDASQTTALSGSSPSFGFFPSTTSSQGSEQPMPSSIVPPVNVALKHPESETFKFDSRKNDHSTTQVSMPKFGSTPAENSTSQPSPSQPKLPSGSSGLTFGTSLTSIPASEPSTSSSSGSHLSFSVVESPAVNVASNPKPEQLFTVPALSSPALSGSGAGIGGKSDISDVAFTQEDEMEEEAPETSQLTLGNFGGFGIGSAPNPAALKPHPFGAPFGNTATPPISPFNAAPSSGLFRPASFNIQPMQPSQPSQQTNLGAFSGGFSSGTSDQTTSGKGFGQPAQIGSGQQALGSVLGAFGQSRQLGTGLPGSAAPPSGFGSGFAGNQSSGGFTNTVPTGGGFATASTGGGFASLASGGGGFGSVATASGGFAAAATAGGGFAAAATGVAGFSGVPGSGFPATGGFGGFGNQGGSATFSAFGGSGGTARPPAELFTQMRK